MKINNKIIALTFLIFTACHQDDKLYNKSIDINSPIENLSNTSYQLQRIPPQTYNSIPKKEHKVPVDTKTKDTSSIAGQDLNETSYNFFVGNTHRTIYSIELNGFLNMDKAFSDLLIFPQMKGCKAQDYDFPYIGPVYSSFNFGDIDAKGIVACQLLLKRFAANDIHRWK